MESQAQLDWLLEEDAELPSARYFALRDLLDAPEDDPELQAARAEVMRAGPVPVILDAQSAEGYWVKPGGGYSPKYRSTVWSLLVLAELGADPGDERVRGGCEYLLEHSLASNAAFSCYMKSSPSGTVLCLNGNMLYALRALGFGKDPRVTAATDWLARAIVGDGELRYYASGTSGPGFACGVNQGKPCAWGANKALRGLLAIPKGERTPMVRRALDVGAGFLLSRNPVEADYPHTDRVSSTWFKLGFPLSYWSDVLETTANLVDLGKSHDERLRPAFEWILAKADEKGRWRLQNSLNRKMWIDFEHQGKPSKMVTLRVLRMLKAAGADLKSSPSNWARALPDGPS